MRNDNRHNIASLLRRTALAVALATGCGLASAGVIHVTIDTASFGVNGGYLDMNLSGSGNVPVETATVTKLLGFQSSPFIDSWGVTSVAGGWQFSNITPNDLFQSVDFGGPLSFDLSFAGAIDPMRTFISEFVVSAFGNDGVTPLGQYDPATGALARFAWTPALSSGIDGQIDVSIADPGVTFIPEPAQCLLIGIGLAALALVRRQRSSKSIGQAA